MSTKRKAPATIAHPVTRQSATKLLKPQINESEAAVSVAEASKTDNANQPADIIEIPSDTESSQYEFDDDELNETNDDDRLPEDAEAASTQIQKQSDNGVADIPMTDSNMPNDAESDQESAQPTLGELARAHGTIDVPLTLTPQSNAVTTQGRAVAHVNHSSLGTVLSQALRTDDSELLESCLRITDYQIIDNTIQRLDSTLAGILISKLASRMHRRPGRAGSLMAWVQTILVCHGGALAAQPSLAKRLSELQRVLDERARGLNSLLALKGKLDLLNTQLKLRRQQWNTEDDDSAHKDEDEGIIYVEGEESDADVANGLMDVDDDDELPVTNGIIDDDSEDDLPSDELEGEEELDAEEELDEDEVNHEDVESEEEESEADGEAGPEPPTKRSKLTRGR
ncbi:Dip2/Utp12 family-domain-containing protein [Xylaria sp. CBS 124048]|nr:Dip2/Utp12 family-domain-containing protein [Xylaria sp. CBS 124048]